MGKKVDFGCGQDVRSGFIGLNYPETEEAEITHDLTEFPYPFKDGEISYALFDNVLEHFDLQQINDIMEELVRICENEATIEVRVPHYLNKNAHTGNHETTFSEVFFDCYSPEHEYPVENIPQNFEVERVEHLWRSQKIVSLLRTFLPEPWVHTFVPNAVDEIKFILKLKK